MARTISVSQGALILGNAGDNPLTVLASVSGAGGRYGIYASNSQTWSITNLGTVTASTGSGIEFKAGGVLTNGTAGLISGKIDGVYAGGAISVANSGVITGGSFGI